MFKAVIISPLPPQRFGEAIYTARLVYTMADTKKIGITAIAGQDADPLDSKGGNVKTLSVWKHSSLLYPISLIGHIKREKPDIVHVQFGPYGKLFGGLFGEVMLLFLILLRLCGFKTTVTLHSTWMPNQVSARAQQYGFLRRFSFLARVMFRIYMRMLDLGTTSIQLSTVKENSSLRELFLKFYGIKPNKVLEIPHPFDLSQKRSNIDEARKKLSVTERQVILTFGFIRRGKGLETAIEAMKSVQKKYENSLLLIAGQAKDQDSMEYLESLRRLCVDARVSSNVRFDVRYIPDEDVPDYFSAASLILIPYTESVGASGPVHNYAAFGVPIIASDIGHHMKESLGGKIILFNSGDSVDLANKIETVLDDTEYAMRVGKEQREYALGEGWDVAALRTLHNYRLTLHQ